jgi:hypothetical protein
MKQSEALDIIWDELKNNEVPCSDVLKLAMDTLGQACETKPEPTQADEPSDGELADAIKKLETVGELVKRHFEADKKGVFQSSSGGGTWNILQEIYGMFGLKRY